MSSQTEKSAPRELVDGHARRRLREDLTSSFVVEAAAGTGKTTVLIERLVATIAAGESLSKIAAVTFTDKAAGELRSRLREKLEARFDATEGELQGRFEQALDDLEQASIGTIHSFCGTLLREFPIEAGLDPLFETMADDEGDALVEQAFEEYFAEAVLAPGPGIRRALRLPRWRADELPQRSLLQAAKQLVEHRDFDAPWACPDYDRRERLGHLVDRCDALGKLAGACPKGDDWLRKSLVEINAVAEVHRLATSEQRQTEEHWDRVEGLLFSLNKGRHWNWKGFGRFGDLNRQEIMADRDALRGEVQAFVSLAEAQLAAQLQSELGEVVRRYEALCLRRGKLDFLGVLLRTKKLLVESAPCRRLLQERFSHVLVDEFQDVDPLQAEVLFLLAAADPDATDWHRLALKPGKLLVVGDPKQAIYRFRRADVTVYETVRQRLLEAGAEHLKLRTSFRAVPELQTFVNAAFEAAMGQGKEGEQAPYVALEAFRQPAGVPAVAALPLVAPYGSYGTQPQGNAMEATCPEAVASLVRTLLDAEHPWRHPDGSPLRPRDICLLFTRRRSFGKDVAAPYIAALQSRGVPSIASGGHSFYAREEVLALGNALRAIEWPDDDISLFATLRGGFFGLSDEALYAYRQTTGSLDPFGRGTSGLDTSVPAPEGDAHTKVQRALAILRKLHRKRHRRSVVETIDAFLKATRGWALFAFFDGAAQALANVQRLRSDAQRFEERGGGLRAYLQWLEADTAAAHRGDAPIFEEEGVRLMTVHGAKGLEFPVVILCDPGAPVESRGPSRFVDTERRLWAMPLCGAAPAELSEHGTAVKAADRAEKVRLAYVAATRAQQLLVLPASGDGLFEKGWYSVTAAGLYAPLEQRPKGEPLDELPPLRPGRPTVLRRNYKADGAGMVPMSSGVHRVGGSDVLWWDPGLLDAQTKPAEDFVGVSWLSPKGEAAQTGSDAHRRWCEQVQQRQVQGRVPKDGRRETVTEVALREGEVSAPATILRTGAWQPERPRGARFGTLVHAVLAEVNLQNPQSLALLAKAHGRLLEATDAEVEAATSAVAAALNHTLLQRAKDAPAEDVLREWPVAQLRPDGTLVEGVIDLALRERDPFGGDRWVVVDYKTDLADGVPEVYRAQVALYAEAVKEATGVEAEAVILGV